MWLLMTLVVWVEGTIAMRCHSMRAGCASGFRHGQRGAGERAGLERRAPRPVPVRQSSAGAGRGAACGAAHEDREAAEARLCAGCPFG